MLLLAAALFYFFQNFSVKSVTKDESDIKGFGWLRVCHQVLIKHPREIPEPTYARPIWYIPSMENDAMQPRTGS